MKKVVALFFLITLLSKCNSDSETCSVPATVRDLTGLDGCGFVFELENGTRLEPNRPLRCGTPPVAKEQSEDPLYNFEFVDGKQVLISYEKTESPSICMVGPVVNITCLTEIASISEE
ncbi:MAG TPA: hypothetical protein VGK39_00815 [Cyclobacteriaceae bacterium]